MFNQKTSEIIESSGWELLFKAYDDDGSGASHFLNFDLIRPNITVAGFVIADRFA